MQEYKMIVLDLDGTLTNSKKELSERNRRALIEVQEAGVCVVLASGRPTYGIVPIARMLELERYGGYILSYNGGVILDCGSGEQIYGNLLPDHLVAPLYEETKRAGCTILSYDGEYIITECGSDEYVGHESFLNKMEVREVPSFLGALREPLPKCLSVGEPERILQLESRLKELFGGEMGIYRSEPFFLELVPQGIDKARSLGRLLEHTGGVREEMVAFGDGFNDLSMIEFAGYGVAMGNGQALVRERADEVVGTNDADGVAVWLEDNILCRL